MIKYTGRVWEQGGKWRAAIDYNKRVRVWLSTFCEAEDVAKSRLSSSLYTLEDFKPSYLMLTTYPDGVDCEMFSTYEKASLTVLQSFEFYTPMVESGRYMTINNHTPPYIRKVGSLVSAAMLTIYNGDGSVYTERNMQILKVGDDE